MAIYNFIQEIRKSKKISQEQIAEFLGCTRQTYIQIENGKRDITINELKSMAELFSIPFDKLILEENSSGFDVNLEIASKDSKNKKELEIRVSVPQNKIDKFKEVLLYVLTKIGARPHVGLTVIYKLLYFIDFDYYEKFEEQLIGAFYQKNKFGPTPVEFKKISDNMIEQKELEEIKSKYYKLKQKKFLPLRLANLNILSAIEVKHIDEVISRLGNKNANELTEYSHQDVPWIMTEENNVIEYESVFYRTHQTSVRNYD